MDFDSLTAIFAYSLRLADKIIQKKMYSSGLQRILEAADAGECNYTPFFCMVSHEPLVTFMICPPQSNVWPS